jgi:hypothetical protein
MKENALNFDGKNNCKGLLTSLRKEPEMDSQLMNPDSGQDQIFNVGTNQWVRIFGFTVLQLPQSSHALLNIVGVNLSDITLIYHSEDLQNMSSGRGNKPFTHDFQLLLSLLELPCLGLLLVLATSFLPYMVSFVTCRSTM